MNEISNKRVVSKGRDEKKERNTKATLEYREKLNWPKTVTADPGDGKETNRTKKKKSLGFA